MSDPIQTLAQSLIDPLQGWGFVLPVSGAWVPVLAGGTVAGAFTYDAVTTGEYTRIGNRVLFNGRVRITAVATAPTGTLRITGLPFAGVAGASAIAGGTNFSLWHGITLTAGHTQLGGRILDTTTSIQFIESGSGVQGLGVVGAAFALIAAVADFQFEGSYRAA
jgi:hypothetical protein